MEQTRIHFVGDELVAGYGDARALGWTGRVMARTRGLDALATTLAVPGETTAQLAERWGPEAARRSVHPGINRLVIGVGVADVVAGVSAARSRLALANILDKAASEHRSCLVVGPPPLWHAAPDATAALSHALGEVCSRRGIPFVETFESLRHHDQWAADVQRHDGRHPGQAGYGLLAWLVLHRGWYEWLGVDQPTD
ncbi:MULTISPECIES: GDSL-type esterase/lipase family protein [Actinomyces]|uniref:Lysophospholipase n=1 Tax=Actinomyces respiraculi TaxID=2744574 RepID=A0A7T0LLP9_9ACTO|nr:MULTISPECIES: GDSL-type esterase/lipase family protein [Actinomyces]QPL05892.1 lysophospholipase [Actinomyces respiraculi]